MCFMKQKTWYFYRARMFCVPDRIPAHLAENMIHKIRIITHGCFIKGSVRWRWSEASSEILACVLCVLLTGSYRRGSFPNKQQHIGAECHSFPEKRKEGVLINHESINRLSCWTCRTSCGLYRKGGREVIFKRSPLNSTSQVLLFLWDS